MEKQKGKVIIAGAGPGDPDLIPIKTLRVIEKADVILYDALVNKALLRCAKERCELVYVGKRKGRHEMSQDSINDLLLKKARHHQLVLRLKGGDPYVFGRGHEEYTHLINNGIDAEVIPGISSAIAGPGAAGIPLTLRGVSESFWVVTGTVSDGSISRDVQLAARSSATIVILMGVNQLPAIAKLVCQLRSPSEPIAIIQSATSDQQRAVTDSAENIVETVNQFNIGSPAVIVIGKVVNAANLTQFLNTEEVKLRMAV